MSTGVGQTWNAEANQNGANWSSYAFQTAQSSYTAQVTPSTPVASTSSSSFTWQAPAHWNVDQQPQNNPPQLPAYVKKPPKAKNRAPEEEEIISATAARFAARLAEDHAAVLNPDVDTPFEDEMDVMKRLLPYHIFQQPKEDLDRIIYGKGKGKAVDFDLKTEIADTKLAIDCHKRLERLRERWRKIKIREGQRSNPSGQAYVLAQAVLESDRADTATLSTELRTARSELDRIQREQRAAASAASASRVTQFSVAPTPPTTAATTTQTQYYRPYPYAYTQQPYGNPAVNATTMTFPVTPAPPPTYQTYQGSAIPVQLPVSSLPALHQLGIIPVPTASLPPEGQQQPPAILRGSSVDGTMLSLEINVSLLQPTQMSGLATILNSLVARNAAQQASAAATVTPNAVADATRKEGP